MCLHIFSDGSPCRGVEHVLRYTDITPDLVLGGPTNFAPIIYHAIRQVKASEKCRILVIIADGQVTNEKETSQAIVEASKYALSIIVVGVGDGPWGEMERNKSIFPERKFKNFHFMNLSEIMCENPEQPALSFAVAALAHIPDQLAAIRRLGFLQTNIKDE
ncbi:Copine [Phytophthora infestans]|uniref:Copine n=1 Tax=Phytophthora infestans TaxID=4787 RepID=A0A833T3T4_PHYIN|nr:Copine [Phytophthora infestans]